jgi:hypothetical protein
VHTWTYSEPAWSTPAVGLNALSPAATWYLHLLPYNALGSFGAERNIGPFLFDGEAPAVFDFRTYNSTGGVIPEPRFNNLLAGVTAQLQFYEGLSGLSLRFFDPADPGTLSAADRGFENGTLPALFSTSGAAQWTVDRGTAAAGFFSAHSGNVVDGQQSVLTLTADTIDGDISFYLKADCEYQYDNLRFSMDGVEMSSWSAILQWTKVSFPIASGRHTFTWSYVKDLWDTELSDTAWIDQLEIPSTATVMVQYSTSAGVNWAPVQSSAAVAAPYLTLTGVDGTVSTQTFTLMNLPPVYSTSAATCSGADPCAATNQVRFFAADRAGNVRIAGPYAVLADTRPTSAVTDLSTAAVYHSSITLRWTAPSDVGPGISGVTEGWYRVDYATYSGYAFSPAVFQAEISTQAVIGSTQTLDVGGLWPHTTYYAVIAAGDRAYNFSGVSNTVLVPPEVPTAYCGLKLFDGAEIVMLGCEPEGRLTSALRISRHGVTFGVILVDVADPAASRIRLNTPDGVRAVRKY